MVKTQKLSAPSGAEIMIREYLTAGQCRELRLVQEKFMRFTMDFQTQKPVMPEVDMALVQKEREDMTIRFAIESYGGSSENVLERLLEAPPGDFEFALEEAEKRTSNPKGQK